jgi:hypothetical protein
MRTFAATVLAVGLGGFFASGCGSSTTTDGGTTTGGVTGTTGGITGGTTGAATGGTTTGGTSGRANGAACSANSQCLSTICGINGSGNCCGAACSTSDATCGATACDTSGACTYPASSTSCGTASCTGNMLTASACNGSGACAAGTPAACPNNLKCNGGGTACLTTCATSTDCDTGFYCNGGSCAAVLADGTACTSNAACSSSVCGVAGTGNCCHMACSTTDLTCGATACGGTGACTYPPTTTSCGTASCSGNMLTPSACNGTGTCAAGTPAACPNHLKCANATSCLAMCSLSTDCASGFYCSSNACVPVLAPGTACTSNASCGSGACGVNGTGNCCMAPCSTTDATCGATACDNTGACTYPPTTTACGPAATCAGSTLTASACNGIGICVPNGGVACPKNLACNSGGTACLASCTVNTNCAGTAVNFCDTLNGGCCAAIVSGTGLSVDSLKGNDTTLCCGYGTAGACQTLTHAMQLVVATNGLTAGTTVTLNATVDGGGGTWSSNETYPVALGWGVTLSGPGVYFTDTGGKAEIFDVALQPGEGAPGSIVTIQGDTSVFPANPVTVGSDQRANLTTDTTSILVETNETLNVNAVDVYEPTGGTGIDVQSGATLDIDNNNAGGSLDLGGNLANGTAIASNMGTGILCNGTISDPNALASHSVVGKGQNISIDAEDGCSLTLTATPTFGWPTAGGYTGAGNGCSTNPIPIDNIGIQANGNASIFLTDAKITCMNSYGVRSTNTASGVLTPSVNINGNKTTIENCALAGVYVTAGTVTVKAGTIDHNSIGVDMENDGVDVPSVTLNDGNNVNNTTVICNSNQETGGTGNPGIDVYNNSTGNVAADYVNWDQWYTPSGTTTATTDLFWCNNSTFACTCQVFDSTATASCVNTGTDDYDLVMGGDGGAITGSETSTNGVQATGHCN